VDTEEGVINQIKKSKFGSLFEAKQVSKIMKSSSTMSQEQGTTGHTDLWNTEIDTFLISKERSEKKSNIAILFNHFF
jgi:hypothetical protein